MMALFVSHFPAISYTPAGWIQREVGEGMLAPTLKTMRIKTYIYNNNNTC